MKIEIELPDYLLDEIRGKTSATAQQSLSEKDMVFATFLMGLAAVHRPLAEERRLETFIKSTYPNFHAMGV